MSIFLIPAPSCDIHKGGSETEFEGILEGESRLYSYLEGEGETGSWDGQW
jgi:hypothetical protein